jgi:hypothetical protein
MFYDAALAASLALISDTSSRDAGVATGAAYVRIEPADVPASAGAQHGKVCMAFRFGGATKPLCSRESILGGRRAKRFSDSQGHAGRSSVRDWPRSS